MKIKTSFLVLLTALSLFVFTGASCPKSPANVAYKTEGVIIASVDTGMQIWADQVRAGHATQSQVDAVKAGYQTYYNAQQAAKAALSKYLASQSKDPADINLANVNVGNAENALLAILNQYILK